MKKLVFAILFLCLLLGGLNFVSAQSEKIEIDFFYSPTCPHCAKEKVFLEQLKEKYPEVEIRRYDVINNSENQKLLREFYEKYQVPQRERGLVPTTFTPTKYFIGFNEIIGQNIENCLKECLGEVGEVSESIKIPWLGKVNISKMSLPVLTITLGALDGFNPCAMWVLLFLIALLINTKSRKRMWLIGGTFLLASGLVYYLILTAWLNFFLAIGYVNLTRILIGIFAMGAGIWQIKNFIQYKPGVCKVADSNLGLMERVKNKLKNYTAKIALSPLTFGILIGVVVLAIAVNLIEFFCSAGIPAIFTRILALNQLNFLSHNLYLLLYTFVFMLDDLIILSLAIITLSKLSTTEKYNYWATMIGGLLIFILGFLLIFKPEILMFA